MMPRGYEKLSLKNRGATCSLAMLSLAVIQFITRRPWEEYPIRQVFFTGDVDEHISIYLDVRATKDAVIGGWHCNFSIHLPFTRC